MINEDRQREAELEKSAESLNRLVEKNAKRFGTAKFRPVTFEDACECLEQLLAKSKRKLAELDSNSYIPPSLALNSCLFV